MPVSVTCSQCGKTYVLKDEYAGKKIRCPDCDNVQVVPIEDVVYATAGEVDEEAGEMVALHPAFQRDKFLMRQKMMSISAKYVVNDEQKRPILFIVRPAHVLRQLMAAFGAIGVFFLGLAVTGAVVFFVVESMGQQVVGIILAVILGISTLVAMILAAVKLSPKRHIEFFTDETQSELVLRVTQDKKLEFPTLSFTVLRPDGKVLAQISKNILSNVIRKKWTVKDPNGFPLFIAREDSLLLSLIRRFVPYLEFMRTNFVYVVPVPGGDEQIRGEFNRKFTIVDSYVLDMTRERPPQIDRRVAIALGVLLDTGERR